jgi:hypothetical protein
VTRSRLIVAAFALATLPLLGGCEDKKAAAGFKDTVEAELERFKKDPGCATTKVDATGQDYTVRCINDAWQAVITADGADKGAKTKVFAIEFYPARNSAITMTGTIPENVVKTAAQAYGFAPDKAAEWYRGERKGELIAGKMRLVSRGAGTILFEING